MTPASHHPAPAPSAAAPSASETRERILDAAEDLFAEHGFQGVSLRQITGMAGVNLAAVNYHFGSREALVMEVYSRVLGPINEQRLRLLDALEASAERAGTPVTVEGVLDAAFRPVMIDLPGSSETAPRFLRLAGACLSEKQDHSPEMMRRVFREVTERFVAALGRALPHLNEADVFWRLHFTVGVLLQALTQGDRLEWLSAGRCRVSDPAETMSQLIAYAAGGLKAPAVARKKGRSPVMPALAGLLLALGAVGCAATPPPDAAGLADLGEVPEGFAMKQGSIGDDTLSDRKSAPAAVLLADHEWVRGFGDERLTALVSEALSGNKDLKVAAARLEAAGANARIAGADLYPQANGLARGSRQKRNFIGFPIGPDTGGGDGGGVFTNLNNEFGLSIDLSWEIDLWGRIRAGQGALLSEYQASEADRAGAELSIAGQVAKSWFALQEAREQLALAERTVTVFQQTEKAVRDRFEAGIADAARNQAAQLRLSMVDIETARANLEARREAVTRAARQIELLLGRYPSGAVEGRGSLPKMPGRPPAGMPGDLLDRRPDLHAAERRLAAADRRLVEAKRAMLPAISLSGSTGTSSEQIEDLLDSNFSIWSLAGNAAQPLLTGGRLREGVVLRKAGIQQAAAEFEKAALTAFGEVENALTAETSLAAREESLRKAADLAGEAYDSAVAEFVAGTGDILTLLTAQDRQFLQRSRLIALRRERLDNRVDLHLALGGGFSAERKASAAAEAP
ncbi:MAG: efflux transporter outer membrane subunit [Verrucomicrobiales bacterium]|nr:efflux transporter outer membrane subunit [Verrucomicrobiales bacterium]